MTKCERAKLRWDCQLRGCFNRKCRPKIEVFADLFPGNIYMGDVDGLVEINGNFLLFEWKSYRGDIPVGQEIMYKRLARKGFCVLVVAGNPETMEAEAYRTYELECFGDWADANLDTVKRVIEQWVRRATCR